MVKTGIKFLTMIAIFMRCPLSLYGLKMRPSNAGQAGIHSIGLFERQDVTGFYMEHRNGRVVFGYCIGKNVIVDIAHKGLIHFNPKKKSIQFLPLRATMLRLLLYMLHAAHGKIITNDEIMAHVWDQYQMSSSNQRLWQVMRDLKNKLSLLGIPDEFIIRVESRGYYVKKHLVKKIYYDCESDHREIESLL